MAGGMEMEKKRQAVRAGGFLSSVEDAGGDGVLEQPGIKGGEAGGVVGELGSLIDTDLLTAPHNACSASEAKLVENAIRELAAMQPSDSAAWREASEPQTTTRMPKALA